MSVHKEKHIELKNPCFGKPEPGDWSYIYQGEDPRQYREEGRGYTKQRVTEGGGSATIQTGRAEAIQIKGWQREDDLL